MPGQEPRPTLYGRLSGSPMVRQFVRYALVGALNVVIFFSLFNLLLVADVHTLLANAIAFVITSVNSFFLNKTWAFKDRRGEAIFRQYLVFVLFTVIGLGLNTAALSLLLIPLHRYGQLGKNLAALGTTPVSVLWNFNAYRRWTFKHDVPVRGASARSL